MPPKEPLALTALAAGAVGIGCAPIFVRLSEVGPSATAFYRILLALPLFWCWMQIQERPTPRLEGEKFSRAQPLSRIGSRSGVLSLRASLLSLWPFVVVGFFFAADLALWHWSMQFTSVANSTLITNFAPILAAVGAWFWFRERTSSAIVVAIILAFLGAAFLVGSSLQLSRAHVWGDFMALITAFFYAGYFLSVKQLRKSVPTPRLMFWSGAFSCAFLILASWLTGETLWPRSPQGWTNPAGLALVSHIGGQGLIAFSLGYLPASFSAVTLFLQPVIAAALAWIILLESLTLLQSLGGVVVLAAIGIAHWSRGTRASSAGLAKPV